MPAPRRRAFQKSTRHSFPVELVLEFPAEVTGEQARQEARRVLEALQVSSLAEGSRALPACHLRCPALHSIIRLGGGDGDGNDDR